MSRTAWGSAAFREVLALDSRRAVRLLESFAPEEGADALSRIPERDAVFCLGQAAPEAAAGVLLAMKADRAAVFLEALHAQAAVEAFRRLPVERRTELIEGLSEKRRRELVELSAYPENSAGRLMSTQFASFLPDTPVSKVVRRLKELAKRSVAVGYVYVVDEEGALKGVVQMRDVVLAEREDLIGSIIQTGVVAVSGFTDREEIVQLAKERRYLAVPVVDGKNRLIGVVRTASLIESGQAEIGEDLQIIFGGSADEKAFSPLREKVLRRLPWLHVNLLTAFLAASVVAAFEDLIARAAALAVFLPIVAGQGGNAGSQSLSVVLRAIVMREVELADAWRLIRAEAAAGVINGAVTGAVTGLAAWLWKGSPMLGLVVAAAMAVNLLAAGAAGAGIPLLMKRLGFDPAQSSGIFLTMVTDVVGFFAFLSFAALLGARLGL